MPTDVELQMDVVTVGWPPHDLVRRQAASPKVQRCATSHGLQPKRDSLYIPAPIEDCAAGLERSIVREYVEFGGMDCDSSGADVL